MLQSNIKRSGGEPIEILVLETEPLGDRSYVVVGGGTAVVIDPQRDIDRLLDLIDERGLQVTHIFETHIHNDYVTGGVELAERTGATYVIPAGEPVEYQCVAAGEAQRFDAGPFAVRSIDTPGHTPHHLSFVLEVDGRDAAVFTGGSMLYGTVGRTDLVDESLTEQLTRAQFHSVRRLADELPGDAEVHPTHGFGSFCSSSASSGAAMSTVATERSSNVAFKTDDEDRFVKNLMAGLSAYPRYYAHMAPVNRQGPDPVDLSPAEPVDAGELSRRIEAGEWVVDLRARSAYSRSHAAGTLNFGLDTPFATYLGWTVPWGSPITLVGDSPDDVGAAQRQLVRIGIDRVSGSAGPAERDELDQSSYRMATFAVTAAEKPDDAVVLDVRRPDEWEDSHIDGAFHIPLHELESRVGELPDAEVWVHCASGYRASIAASMLDRAGRRVVLIDDDWSQARAAGLLPPTT